MLDTSPGEQRYRAMRKVTVVGAVTNFLLALTQTVGGVLVQSQALIADGMHTVSDLLSDFLVLVAARKANAPADQDHRYGHERIETLTTVGLGLALVGVGLWIMVDAVGRLLSPETLLSPGPIALLLAVLGIVAKEALYHYTARAASRLDSGLLKANAWHHRSDVLSSIIVLLGLGTTLLGFPFMDAVAAILVALLIAVMGARFIWNSASELIDTGISIQEEERMLALVRSIDGVVGVHELRTRRMGTGLLADVHIEVHPKISVSEGHRIAESVAQILRSRQKELREVLVHVDPEDDRAAAPSSHLPCREELLEKLRLQWQAIPGALPMDDVVLHYLQGKVHLDIQLPGENFSSLQQARQVSRQIEAASRELAGIGEVRIMIH